MFGGRALHWLIRERLQSQNTVRLSFFWLNVPLFYVDNFYAFLEAINGKSSGRILFLVLTTDNENMGKIC